MVLTLMGILLGVLSGISQTTDSTEVKVGNMVYMRWQAHSYIVVWNKANAYYGKDFNYDSQLGHRRTQFHDEEQIIKECVNYLVDSVDSKVIAHNDDVVTRYKNMENSITLTFYADLKGNVKNVSMYYSEKLDIPIEIIHKLFEKLRRSNIKLDFNPHDKVFQDARFIVKEYFTNWRTLRHCAKTRQYGD